MGRCQLLQMLAVLGVVSLQANVDRANATEQQIAQADQSQAAQAQQPRKQDDVPPGGCTPIGLTASGEMVFPLLCRALLEQQRGPISQELPTAISKQDAAVTASKQESTTTDSPAAASKPGSPTAESKQESPPPAASKPELATAPPNPAPPTTTSALSTPDAALQIAATGKPGLTAKDLKRNSRKKQLAGRRGGRNAATESDVTGSVKR
jgi:hypothetical protein